MSAPQSAEIDALIAERDRVMDMEPAGSLAAERQGEVIADLSRRINQLARDARPIPPATTEGGDA